MSFLCLNCGRPVVEKTFNWSLLSKVPNSFILERRNFIRTSQGMEESSSMCSLVPL